MTEVHSTVNGYSQVYACSDSWEKYFYFGEGEAGIRFLIMYDKNGDFLYLRGDGDSDPIEVTTNCVPGLLGE